MNHYMERFNQWMQHPELDPEIKAELVRIQENEKEIEERFYTQLSFGTGGLRGEIGAGTNRMNRYIIRKATLGLSQYVHKKEDKNPSDQKSVVIAYDCRHKSPEFAEEAALTLAHQGIRAYVYPALRSTPQLSFTVRKLKADAGIMITASHNPPEYNGYKAYGNDGAQLNLEDADEVIRYVNQVENELEVKIMDKQAAIEQQLLVYLDNTLDQQYIDYVSSLAIETEMIREMAEQYKIVFTPFHGTGLFPVEKVLDKVGFKKVKIMEEQAVPDPNFSTVKSPNPEEHAAFELAIRYAKEHGADMIMGTDPDADRMGVVVQNKAGEYVVLTGNQTGALLLHYLLSRKKERGTLHPQDTICKTIVTSEMGRVIGEAFGVQTIDTLTGFKFIGEKIRQFYENGTGRYLFGYEESYGYLVGDEVRDKDAIQAVLLSAEMGAYYKSKGMTLLDALEELYQEHGYFKEDTISITLKGKEGVQKIVEAIDHLRSNPVTQCASQSVEMIEDYKKQERTIYTADGTVEGVEQILLPQSNVVKYFLKNGAWFCVRPSGTEPKLKIYIGVRGRSEQESLFQMAEIKEEIARVIPL
ncbi:phospho-sugar mutase [Caldalkalibacillus mannanilyticus]|uniref:phospho-sugar mutase n=1 Tax=Caldalkalibacillus mannanilyticus TaxID=1418 RepID=UPI00046A4A30|nr:phospho-sugar mutase [Caldalkalibacillus mannanilyticus]